MIYMVSTVCATARKCHAARPKNSRRSMAESSRVAALTAYFDHCTRKLSLSGIEKGTAASGCDGFPGPGETVRPRGRDWPPAISVATRIRPRHAAIEAISGAVKRARLGTISIDSDRRFLAASPPGVFPSPAHMTRGYG